jgi:hypothetical protein
MTRPPLAFYLVPESAALPPLHEDWLHAAQRQLGVDLPRELVQLLRLQNGGQLRYDSHAADIDDRDHVNIYDLRGIGPAERDGLRHNQYDVEEWELPGGLVLLDGDGHQWISLDYRNSVTAPSVCWLEAGTNRTVTLAPTFAGFLTGLRRGDHWVCFGFAQPTSEVLNQLTAVLQLSFRESGLVPGSQEAQHRVWRDEFGEPAQLHVEPNNPLFAQGFPEHPDCVTIVRVDVLAEHRPALATAMAALGLDARLLHSPPWRQLPQNS